MICPPSPGKERTRSSGDEGSDPLSLVRALPGKSGTSQRILRDLRWLVTIDEGRSRPEEAWEQSREYTGKTAGGFDRSTTQKPLASVPATSHTALSTSAPKCVNRLQVSWGEGG